jgi:hypothetical protein
MTIVPTGQSSSASATSSPDHPLTSIIDELAHLLPAQGPISIFIHHNTLHAFEHLPFEEAVERAASQLGREPFLAESRYRDKLTSGRILARDVEALLVEQLGAGGANHLAGVGSRLDLCGLSCCTGFLQRAAESSCGSSKKPQR